MKKSNNYKMKINNWSSQNLNYAHYQIFLSFRWLILSTRRDNNKFIIKSRRRMSKKNRILKTEILMQFLKAFHLSARKF